MNHQKIKIPRLPNEPDRNTPEWDAWAKERRLLWAEQARIDTDRIRISDWPYIAVPFLLVTVLAGLEWMRNRFRKR